jgi:hypothetical protein
MAVWLIYADGSSLTSNTYVVYSDGERRHRFRQEESLRGPLGWRPNSGVLRSLLVPFVAGNTGFVGE